MNPDRRPFLFALMVFLVALFSHGKSQAADFPAMIKWRWTAAMSHCDSIGHIDTAKCGWYSVQGQSGTLSPPYGACSNPGCKDQYEPTFQAGPTGTAPNRRWYFTATFVTHTNSPPPTNGSHGSDYLSEVGIGCPAGTTLNPQNNRCVCPEGQTVGADGYSCVDGALASCQADCTACVAKLEAIESSTLGGGADPLLNDANGGPRAPVCYSGCVMNYAFKSKSQSGDGWWGSLRYATGATCTDQPARDTPDKATRCPDGQVPGSINGQQVCVRGGETLSGPSTPASGATPAETVETVCRNNMCETITKIGGEVTKREYTDIGTYCSRFPQMGHCSGLTSNGSSGGAQGSGTGGSALNTTGSGGGGGDDSEGECDANPDRAGCKSLGEAPSAPPLTTVDVPLSITPVSGFGPSNGICPAPRTATLAMGLTISMPFDLLCDFAEGIRPVVVGLAWLSAILSFMGLSRRET